MKITEYSKVNAIDDSTVLLIDGNGGTKTILAKDALRAILEVLPQENRRGFFGGKYLGTSVTAAQKAAIKDGSFKGMMIGDYWTINSVNYRIADMDYWWNCGDTSFNQHHLVIVPDSSLYSAAMNDDNITTNGYAGSKMHEENLNDAKTRIKAAFSDMVLSHREYLTNAVTSGYPSGGSWYDSEVDLMNEIMVYGSYVHTPAGNGTRIPTRYTINNSQLALFRLNPKFIKTRYTYWLRDVVSAAHFAYVTGVGNADFSGASNSRGVRPVFAIG